MCIKSSLLLLSGGVDSVALAYWTRPEVALTVDYGQKAAVAEFRAAGAVANELGIPLKTIQINTSMLGLGTMCANETGSAKHEQISPTPEWWPFRNQLLITIGASIALRDGYSSVMIGTVRGDESHADGTPEFVEMMNGLLRLQEGQISLIAPAIDLNTVELLYESQIPKDILAWAHSCHRGNWPCGECRGCAKREQTLDAIGGL